MRKKTEDYNEYLYGKLLDPRNAANYLSACDEDSTELLLLAMRDVAEAHQMSKVALGADLNRESLYKTLSSNGHPQYETLKNILRAFGLKFTIAVAEAPLRKKLPAKKTVRAAPMVRGVRRARRKQA